VGAGIAEENDKIEEELSEEERIHRQHIMIGAVATVVMLLAVGLQLARYNMDDAKVLLQKQAAQQAAIEEAQRNDFGIKEEIKEFKKEREVLFKKIDSESRMIQWGVERQTNPTVVQQAKSRRDKHQQRLEFVKKQISKLRDM
jgi:hypothetical protein